MSSQTEDTEVLFLHDLGGRVTDVDENSATFTAWKSSYETPVEAKLTGKPISILRKSTSFKKVVSNVKDFLFEGDEVVINIKQDKTDQTQWNVTRVRLCPDQRPPHYDVVRDYFVIGKQARKQSPARWPKNQFKCHVPHARVGEIVSLMSEILQRWCKIPINLFHDIVDEYCDDQGGVFQSYIKTKRALTSFIRTVPQYFYMDDDDRVCMYEGFDDELFKTEFAEICLVRIDLKIHVYQWQTMIVNWSFIKPRMFYDHAL